VAKRGVMQASARPVSRVLTAPAAEVAFTTHSGTTPTLGPSPNTLGDVHATRQISAVPMCSRRSQATKMLILE
jgi:hypothetical protein